MIQFINKNEIITKPYTLKNHTPRWLNIIIYEYIYLLSEHHQPLNNCLCNHQEYIVLKSLKIIVSVYVHYILCLTDASDEKLSNCFSCVFSWQAINIIKYFVSFEYKKKKVFFFYFCFILYMFQPYNFAVFSF